MPRLLSVITSLCLCAAPLGALLVEDPSSTSKADLLLRRGRWAEAERAYEEVLAREPDHALAWFHLGYVTSAQGKFERAIEANQRAATFPEVRPTALYNLACNYARTDALEAASTTLDASIAAGQLDFDLMASDPDLASLRAAGRVSLPREPVWKMLEARNGLTVRHALLVPEDLDPERPVTAFLAFAPGGGGPLSTAWAIEELWAGLATHANAVVLCPVVPDDSWFTHPAHHALEDLLKHVERELAIEGDRFHFIGFASGARAATTYSRMSKRYARSLTVLSSLGWSSFDDDELARWDELPVHQIVGGADPGPLELARHTHAVFESNGLPARLTIVSDGTPLLHDLRGASLAQAILAALLPTSK